MLSTRKNTSVPQKGHGRLAPIANVVASLLAARHLGTRRGRAAPTSTVCAFKAGLQVCTQAVPQALLHAASHRMPIGTYVSKPHYAHCTLQ